MPRCASFFMTASAAMVAPSMGGYLRRHQESALTALRAGQGALSSGGEFTWYQGGSDDIKDADLDFSAGVLAHSNLGGKGPDSGDESLRFANIGKQGDVVFDMVIRVAEGYNYDGDTTKNLLDDTADMAQINLYCGESSMFQVSMVETGTNTSVSVDRFFLTILDIDAGSPLGEGPHPETAAGLETNKIGPISSFYVDPAQEITIVRHPPMYAFTATMSGSSADNPTDPWNLDEVQSKRAVMAEFRGMSTFEMGMSSTPGEAKRNMLFSGPSSLMHSGFGPCMYNQSLDLSMAKLTVNNLGGSDALVPSSMIFEGAMHVEGTAVDLNVKALSPYKAGNPQRNGKFGDFGQINMAADTAAVFRFSFTSGGEAFTIKDLFFSFFDIDAEGQGGHESLAMLSAGGTFFLSESTVISANTDNISTPVFNATLYGTADDNPVSADDVTQSQVDEAITFHFHRPVHYFDVALATPGMQAPRNFAFGGDIALACGR